jgi:hypothetical protein
MKQTYGEIFLVRTHKRHPGFDKFVSKINIYTVSSDVFVKNVGVHHLPGITPESIETCTDLLRQNHEKNHVFFNVRGGFQNHTAHHLLAALSVGASSDTLKHIYEQQKKIQLP